MCDVFVIIMEEYVEIDAHCEFVLCVCRLWINWPRPKCAFVPVSIRLEVSELCGGIRFGVRRGMSFMSFMKEPYTRFSVQSEVGDQYKLKNVPKLSSIIVNKLKQHIRKKMVYPNCFKFRLIWPRTWWPEGTENLFRSETTITNDTPQMVSTPSGGDGLSVVTPERVDTSEDVERTTTTSDLSLGTGEGGAGMGRSPSTAREHVMRWFLRPHQGHAKKSSGPLSPRASAKMRPSSVHTALEMEGGEHEGEAMSPRSRGGSNLQSDKSHTDDDEDVSETESLFPTTNKITRSRSEGRRLAASPVARSKNSLVAQDHVRMYVSSLLATAASNGSSSVLLARRAADDICVRDKQFASESIAIVRTRAHSIADFRHGTLEGMWAEFLGSIGHDFAQLQSQISNDDNEGGDDGRRDARGQRMWGTKRRFSSSLMSWRSKLLGGGSRILGQRGHPNTTSAISALEHEGVDEDDGSAHSRNYGFSTPGDGAKAGGLAKPSAHEISPPTGGIGEGSGILRFGKKILNTQRSVSQYAVSSNQKQPSTLQVAQSSHHSQDKDTSRISPCPAIAHAVATPVAQPTAPTRTNSSAAIAAVDHHTSTATTTPPNKPKSSYGHKLGLVVGAMGAIAEGVRGHKKDPHGHTYAGSAVSGKESSRGMHIAAGTTDNVDDLDEAELEKEVMNLTWQAHAQAISQAAQRGEAIHMQNFMHTPYQDAAKKWVVMRDGFLVIYPNSTHEVGAVEKGQPLAKYNLIGCTCRPLEQPLGFEVGFVVGSPIRDSMIAPQLHPAGSRGATSREEADMEWVQFWTETDMQCRTWIMALQCSADLKIK